MKAIACSGLSVLLSGVSLAGGERTFAVSVPDASGAVTVSVGAGTKDQSVLAAWANGDRGADAMTWMEFKHVVPVKADGTNVVYRLPESWRAKSGAVRFFLMSEIIPYAHRYEYITRPVVATDGDLYADTGVKPDSSLDLTIKSQSVNTTGMCSFGIVSTVYLMPAGTYYWYDFFGAKNSTSDNHLGPGQKNVFGQTPPVDASPHVVQMNSSGIKIDGYRFLEFDASTITYGASNKTLTLFGRNSSWKQKDTSCSIYFARLSMNGCLVRDYIPCMKNSKVTLFDRVNRTAITVSGNRKDSLAFVAGPEVDPEPQDCGSVEAVSQVFRLAPSIDVVALHRSAETVDLRLGGSHDDGILLAVNSGSDYSVEDDATALYLTDVASGVADVVVPLPQSWWRAHDSVRFVWKSKAGLPYDREVTSLRSDAAGLAHIRTGWCPTTNTEVAVSARLGVDVCSFGVMGQIYFFRWYDETKYAWGFPGANGTGTFPTVPTDDFHEYRVGPGGVYFDGAQVADIVSKIQPDSGYSMTIPYRANNFDLGINKTGDADVRSAKIWERDELVRDYVPCVKDGVAGLYDRALGVFYAPEEQTDLISGGAFQPGETVLPAGDAISLSRVVTLRTGLVIVFH